MGITTITMSLGSIRAGSTVLCDDHPAGRCAVSLYYTLTELTDSEASGPSVSKLAEQALKRATHAGWRSDLAGEFCPRCALKASTEDELLEVCT